MFSREVPLLKDLLEHSEMGSQSLELQQLPSQLDELKMSMSIIKAERDCYLDTLIAAPTGTGQSTSYRGKHHKLAGAVVAKDFFVKY